MKQRSFATLDKIVLKGYVKPRIAAKAHLSCLFGTEAKEPVDEVEQDIPQVEPAENVSQVQIPHLHSVSKTSDPLSPFPQIGLKARREIPLRISPIATIWRKFSRSRKTISPTMSETTT